MMLKIGLTGGIGSGKSTVAELFAEQGVEVIDADAIAKTLTEPGTEYFEAIANYFGDEALEENGTLNRTKIKEMIFREKTKRQWLEKLLHPVIRQTMKRQIEKVEGPYCLLMIPLLVEAQSHEMVDRILVVDADEKTQLARLKARDNLNDEEAKLIINAQAKREERLGQANDVIQNNGSLDELKKQVETMHQHYLELAMKG